MRRPCSIPVMKKWSNIPRGFYPIPRCSGYFANRKGEVFSNHSKRCLKLSTSSDGYPRLAISVGRGQQQYRYVHILIAQMFIGRCPKGMEVDHRNRVRNDNRSRNLRYVTFSRQIHNTSRRRRIARTPKTPFKGVIFRHHLKFRRKPWTAAIMCRGQSFTLGYHTSDYSAARAYDRAAISLFGHSATTNKSLGYFE